MPSVTKVEPKGDKAATVHFDVGQVAWSPDYEVAKKLEIGKPLPEGWTLKEGQYGPQALPPKPKGSAPQPAYRNTKEGQAYEQERMDRRTALMQAVTTWSESADSARMVKPIGELADEFYEWLRKTSGGEKTGPAPAGVLGQAQPSGPPPGTIPPPLRGEGDTAVSGSKADSHLGMRGDGPAGLGGMQESVQTQDGLDDLWAQASEIGLSPPRAMMLARKLGLDHVRSSTDLLPGELEALIEARKAELAT